MTKQALALRKLRTNLDVVLTLARQAGVSSRAIADILETQAETYHQNQALTAPSSYVRA
jgi:hypothetical protein